MASDPWRGIPAPTDASCLNTRRVDADGTWNFFWARGMQRQCLLVLRHSEQLRSGGSLPKARGLHVSDNPGEEPDDAWVLTFGLDDPAQRDIFYHLCNDIIASTVDAADERDAVARAVARTWRWHHLLRGGRSGLLPEQEQRGLIGELLVLEDRVIPNLPASDAVDAWQGPFGAPKDFEVERAGLEVKARRGGARPFVAISSEHQLDGSGMERLFLAVLELDRSPSDSTEGFSLTDVATRIRDRLESRDPGATGKFEAALVASGFSWDDDYSGTRWIRGNSNVYLVDASFPRITASQVPSGVSQVRYSLSLAECTPFLAAEDTLPSSLRLPDGQRT